MASTPQKIGIGTRGSPLALAQAHEVRDRLIAAHGADALDIEIHVISVVGDRVQDRALSEIGGKGLFTDEIEAQLISGEIDLAVHSSKDMPTKLPDGLALIAFLEREDPRDAFISNSVKSILEMPEGAVLGTSSLRRQALALRARPDLNIVGFRGNVQTRLRKLSEGVADATLLASAGLRRLGMIDVATEVIDTNIFPPAPGQGAICVEGRIGDQRILDLVEPIRHAPTEIALACERAFLATLDGSCRTPIAAYATIDGEHISFEGTILRPDGSQAHDVKMEGRIGEAAEIGMRAGAHVRAAAGDDFFKDWQ